MSEPTIEELNEALDNAAVQDAYEYYERNVNPTLSVTYPILESTERTELYKAMAIIQEKVEPVAKTTQGYGYKYAALDAVIKVIMKAKKGTGISIFQWPHLVKGDNPAVAVFTRINHESGQYFQTAFDVPIAVMQNLSPAQMIGVAITYGRRYALQSLFLIASEEDTDGTIS